LTVGAAEAVDAKHNAMTRPVETWWRVRIAHLLERRPRDPVADDAGTRGERRASIGMGLSDTTRARKFRAA